MTNAISVCPICHCEELVQNFLSSHLGEEKVIGGRYTARPPVLNGCHCSSCGMRFVFDKKGKCPVCEGTEMFEYKIYKSGILLHTYWGGCPTCGGTGQIQ